MRRGQVSIDMLLAVITFLVILSLMQPVINNTAQLALDNAVLTQEKEIAAAIAEMIAVSKSLSTVSANGTAQLDFNVPMLYIPGKLMPMDCNIFITDENVTVSTTFEGRILSQSVAYRASGANHPNTARCGEPITISYP
jgi:hypothetical protein